MATVTACRASFPALCAALMVTVQVRFVPLQSPPQPSKTKSADAGAAVNVTAVLLAYDSLQSLPQLMPAGAEVTLPEPDLVSVAYTSVSDRATAFHRCCRRHHIRLTPVLH